MLRRIVVLALIVAMLFSTSCTCPFLPSSVECPGVTSDNSGGAIVAYEVYKGDSRNVYVQRIGPGGKILWGEKGVPLYIAQGRTEGDGKTALAVADGYGGVILVWWEEQGLFAQKMDSSGHTLWQEGGILASTGYVGNYKMVSDSLGGAIISWSDDWGKLYLQRVDSEGSLLWLKADAPIHLRTYPMAASHTFDIASDDSGGAITVWKSEGHSIFAQKIDSEGNILWRQGELLVSAPHQESPQVVSDGSGGAIIVWMHNILSENGHGYSGSDIYAQRINAEGNILWEPDGVPICIGSKEAADPHIISDGLGGAIVTWRAPCSIYAQRIDSKGNVLWPRNGIQVWEAEGPQSPHYCITSDGFNGAIIVWWYVEEGKSVDQGGVLRAQRLDASGRKLWETNGTLVSTDPSWGYSYGPIISGDGHGGVIVSWTAGKRMHASNLSYVQRIDAQGNRLWGEKGILLNG